MAELKKAAGPLWLFDAPADAGRTVATTVDSTRRVTKTVGPGGGKIEVSTAAGDSLTLTIPEGALLEPTEISGTPVTSMAGASGAGARPLGLELQPEGLTLLEPAILDVVPVGGDVARPAVGATGNEDGTATRPTWMLADPERLAMPVQHFSHHTVLVANGENGFVAEYFTDADYLASIQTQIAQLLSSERNAQIEGAEPDPQVFEEIDKLLDAYYEDVLVPLIERSGRDCEYAETNYYDAVAFSRQIQMLGIGDREQVQTISAGCTTAMRNCWAEATAECLRMDPAQFRRLIQYARHFQMTNQTLANGEVPDPFDPGQVRWCGTLNGWIDIEEERHAEWDTSVEDGEQSVRVWVTANPQMYWTQGGDLSDFFLDPTHDAGSLVTASGYDREEGWSGPDCPMTSVEEYAVPPQPFTFSMSANFDWLDNPVKRNELGWVSMDHNFSGQNFRLETCSSVSTGQTADYRFSVNNLPLNMTWDRARSAVDVSFSESFQSENVTARVEGAGTLYIGRNFPS